MNLHLDNSNIPDNNPSFNLLSLSEHQFPLMIIDSYKNKINVILDEYQENESQDLEMLELLGSSSGDSEDSSTMSPELVNTLELSLILLDKIANSYK